MSFIRKGYIDTAWGQIHYRTAGDQAAAVPLVLLHQTPSSSVMYERLMGELAADFRLIAPDTPGFGSSFVPAERPQIGLYAEAITAALTTLGVEQCCLFGHHTGASIAAQITADAPQLVQKLILSGPPNLTTAQIDLLRTKVMPFTPDENGHYFSDMWSQIRAKNSQLTLELSYREAVLGLQAAEQYAAAYEAVFEHELATLFPRIHCPTLLMAGEHDSIRASLEPTAAALPQAQTHIILGADTYICETHTQKVADIIRTFCKP
ncbi:MAG: alpha/beta hydrolase [Anaerolineales bacterium]|nr:alpha/beta hydrolase [Anaerolineales bacterium]